MWQRDTSGECPDEDEGNRTIITNAISTAYAISEREEGSFYRITVTAVNSRKNVRIASNPVTAVTEEAGER